MTKTATTNEKRRISDRRGVVARPIASNTPQSRGRLSAVSVRACQFEGCDKPLTGRQRAYCSDSHRAMASKKRRQEAQPVTLAQVDARIREISRPGALLGSRKPSYVLIPKHTSSKGREAAELMRSAGVTLDPWQKDVLEGALGRLQGRWSARIITLLTGRQNGKSEVGIAAALHLALSAPKKLAIIAAHEVKTGDEIFIRLRDIVETPAFEAYEPKVYSANGQQGIRFNNGSRIRFVARSKHQVRGFSVDLLVIEEAMILTDTAWSSLMPALSAKDGQIWLIGTAPLPTSEVLRRYAVLGRSGEQMDLAHFEWAASLEAVPSDIEAIAQANPALGRLRLDWVMEELRGMKPEDYGRERLGWWREDETPSPFPPGSWDALTYQGHLDVVGTPCFSVDVSPMRDSSTIGVAANTDADRPLVEVVEAQRGTSWVVPKLQEVLERYPATEVIVDRSAWAASLADDIRAAGITVHETNAAEVSTAAGQFLEAVLEAKFFHRGDPRLTTAVEGARQRPIGERWGWDRKTPTVDITPLVAASLSLWGLGTLKPSPIYWVL